jgi:hypothetical protein
MSVHEYLSSDELDVAALERYLDGLDDGGRVRAVRGLSPREQARLFEAAAGGRPIRLGDMVPPDAAPLTQVIHYGRNSLPVFRVFEKRFCRPAEGDRELWGYNEHAVRWATGPGYFVARDHGDGEVLIDYLEVPPAKPESWPRIRPNSSGPARFVYGGMQDVLRGVTRHVSVGRATRGGKPMDNWFVLCRGASGNIA